MRRKALSDPDSGWWLLASSAVVVVVAADLWLVFTGGLDEAPNPAVGFVLWTAMWTIAAPFIVGAATAT